MKGVIEVDPDEAIGRSGRGSRRERRHHHDLGEAAIWTPGLAASDYLKKRIGQTPASARGSSSRWSVVTSVAEVSRARASAKQSARETLRQAALSLPAVLQIEDGTSSISSKTIPRENLL